MKTKLAVWAKGAEYATVTSIDYDFAIKPMTVYISEYELPQPSRLFYSLGRTQHRQNTTTSFIITQSSKQLYVEKIEPCEDITISVVLNKLKYFSDLKYIAIQTPSSRVIQLHSKVLKKYLGLDEELNPSMDDNNTNEPVYGTVTFPSIESSVLNSVLAHSFKLSELKVVDGYDQSTIIEEALANPNGVWKLLILDEQASSETEIVECKLTFKSNILEVECAALDLSSGDYRKLESTFVDNKLYVKGTTALDLHPIVSVTEYTTPKVKIVGNYGTKAIVEEVEVGSSSSLYTSINSIRLSESVSGILEVEAEVVATPFTALCNVGVAVEDMRVIKRSILEEPKLNTGEVKSHSVSLRNLCN